MIYLVRVPSRSNFHKRLKILHNTHVYMEFSIYAKWLIEWYLLFGVFGIPEVILTLCKKLETKVVYYFSFHKSCPFRPVLAWKKDELNTFRLMLGKIEICFTTLNIQYTCLIVWIFFFNSSSNSAFFWKTIYFEGIFLCIYKNKKTKNNCH